MKIRKVKTKKPDIEIRVTWDEMELLFEELNRATKQISLPGLMTLRNELLTKIGPTGALRDPRL